MGKSKKNHLGIVSLADELKKLADLRQSGALTAEEFQIQKRRLLDQQDDTVIAAIYPSSPTKKTKSDKLINASNVICVIGILCLLLFITHRWATYGSNDVSGRNDISKSNLLEAYFAQSRMFLAFSAAGISSSHVNDSEITAAPPSKYERKIIEGGVARLLKDPQSAIYKWDNHKISRAYYCGYVNSKNGFGGYGEETRTLVTVNKDGRLMLLGMVKNPFLTLTVDKIYLGEQAEKACA